MSRTNGHPVRISSTKRATGAAGKKSGKKSKGVQKKFGPAKGSARIAAFTEGKAMWTARTNLRNLWLSRGITQKQLGDLCGCSQGWIADIMSPAPAMRRKLHVNLLEAMAGALGATIIDLFTPGRFPAPPASSIRRRTGWKPRASRQS